MKKVFFILSSIALVACGAPDNKSSITDLKTKKEKLLNSRDSINVLLSEVESKIAALDTSKVYDVVSSLEVTPDVFYIILMFLGQLRQIRASTYTRQLAVPLRRFMSRMDNVSIRVNFFYL